MDDGSHGADRPNTREDRYESLKSLGRLLQYDMETELQSQRVALPVIDVNAFPAKSNKRKRSSSVIDYMQQLKSVRRQMLSRLTPDAKGIKTEKPKRKNNRSKAKKQIHIEINTTSTPRENTDTPEESSPQDDKVEDDESISDSIENLRERLARFEALKNVRRSFHADDFQQYLGARYLQVHRRRARCLGLRRANTSLETVRDLDESVDSGTPRSEYGTISNSTSLSRAGTESSCSGQLPAISLTGLRGMSAGENAQYTVSSARHRPMLDYSDMQYELSRSDNRSGIPHHAAKRAHMRYFHAHGLSSILSKLRKGTCTTALHKSEQEKLPKALK